MRDYVITVNSTVDVPKLWLEERHVPVVALKYTIDGETYTDMEGLTAKEFFEKLREGKMSVTSQVNPEEAMEALEPFVKEGKDILQLGFSSGLSGTLNSMRLAEAVWLLREDHVKIGLLCEKSGFRDARYFSQVFKKAFGCSPGEFRKNAGQQKNHSIKSILELIQEKK